MAEERSVIMDDTSIVAYLHYRGFKFSPVKKGKDDRVGFKVLGDIDSALSDFYSNDQVGIQDFIGCLKAVRGSMFLTKEMNKQN